MTDDLLFNEGKGAHDDAAVSLLGQIIAISKAAFTLDRDARALSEETREQDRKLALIAGETRTGKDASEAIGDLARELAEMSGRASSVAGEGDLAQRDFLAGIARIHATLGDANGFMGRLKDDSDEIKRLSGLLVDIGDRLNVLSINASIEAARSGQAGKGFAVIAREMRNLYQRVDDSAIAVERIVSKVIEGVAVTGRNLAASGSALATSKSQAESIGKDLERLDGINAELSVKTREIALLAEGQLEINRRIESLATEIGANGSEIRERAEISRDNAQSVHLAVDRALMSLDGKRFPWHDTAERAMRELMKSVGESRSPEDELAKAFTRHPGFELFYVIGGNGTQTSENVWNPAFGISPPPGKAKGENRREKDYYAKAIAAEGTCVFSGIYVSCATDSLCATASVAYRGARGLEVLAGDVNLDGMLSG